MLKLDLSKLSGFLPEDYAASRKDALAQAAQMLLLALVFYLHYEAPPDEQNFPMVMEMIRAGEVRAGRAVLQTLLLLIPVVDVAAAVILYRTSPGNGTRPEGSSQEPSAS